MATIGVEGREGKGREGKGSAWRPGKVVREAGREGSVSHLLGGPLPFGGPLRLVSFGFLCLERDPRVSPTSQLLFWLKKQGAALRAGPYRPPYAASLRMVALRGGS